MLWTVTNEDDTQATQCFRFNTFTKAWVNWPIVKTCSRVNIADDKIYLGAGDTNFIEIERKAYNRKDHADREFTKNINNNSVTGDLVVLSNIADITTGDVLIQKQYLTFNKYNRLLNKLDIENGLDGDYFNTLEAISGDNLTSKMTALISKLNADSGTASVYTFSGTTDFETIRTEFNTIITTLNSDTGVVQSNFQPSTGTIEKEAVIVDITSSSNRVQLKYPLLLMVGPITIYSHIETKIVWAPSAFGDPSITKHVREGTYIFKQNNFTSVLVSYRTDLSKGFEEIQLNGLGIGSFGMFQWSNHTWGGEGNAVPFRTLIPQQKQRCRYMECKFNHSVAFEKYDLYGISLTYEPISTRGYR